VRVGRGRGRVEPDQLRRVGDAGRRQLERQRGEVGGEDLGRVVRQEVVLLVLRPEADADAGAQAAGAAAPLVGRGARDAHRLQPRHPAARGEARHARESRVHDRAHALDRQARLGDGRGEDDLPPPRLGGGDRAVLIRLRQVAVERGDERARRQRAVAADEQRLDAADLALAGEEGEDVAAALARQHVSHRGRHRRLDRGRRLGAAGGPPRLDREAAPLARHDRRAAQQRGDRPAVERGRHDEDAQLLAQQRARLEAEREPEVRVQAALVELVEDDESRSLERGVALEHAREHAFGDDLDPRGRADARVHAHAVADRVPHALAEGVRHPPRRRARRQPPRLEHHDLLLPQPGFIEQRQRHPRRLSCSRRRLEHGARVRAQRVSQGREDGVDREEHEGKIRDAGCGMRDAGRPAPLRDRRPAATRFRHADRSLTSRQLPGKAPRVTHLQALHPAPRVPHPASPTWPS